MVGYPSDEAMNVPTTSQKQVKQRKYWSKFKKAEEKQLDNHFGL